jgi:2-iminobutanoate/2-iminopropanoate deaminase
MTRTAITTTGAPAPGGAYSQGVVAHGLLFTAGFGPQNPDTGAVAPTVGEQTHQVLRTIAAVLTEVGATLDDVVKTTVHLHELERDFAEYDAAYREHFSEPFPVRTTVGSRLLGILVEIDVVVALPTEP